MADINTAIESLRKLASTATSTNAPTMWRGKAPETLAATLTSGTPVTSKAAADWTVKDSTYKYINNIDNAREKAYKNIALSNGNGGDPFSQYDNLTSDEIGTYNYKFKIGGKAAADEYLKSLSLSVRQYSKAEPVAQKYASEHPVLGTAMAVPMRVMGGTAAAVDLAAQNVNRVFTGKAVNYNSSAQTSQKLGNAMVGQVTQDIEKSTKFKIGDTNVASFLYNAAVSTAESALASLVPGGAALLGLGAGAQTAREVAARGGSDNQAMVLGITAGVFEGLFEAWSIGKFKALKDVKVPKDIPYAFIKTLAGNVGKSMVVNFSDEAATEIANIVADALFMGVASNATIAIREYEKTMPHSKAVWKTVWDLVQQVLWAGAAGAVTGGLFGTMGTTQSAISNSLENSAQNQQPAQPVTQLPTQPQAVQAPTSPAVATSQTASVAQPQTVQTQSANPDLGAAAKDAFSPYTQLQAEATEFHPQGEKPRAETRSVQVPTKDAEGKNISKTIATAMEAPVTPDSAIPDIQDKTAEGAFSHWAFTDKAAKERAVNTIKTKGYQQALIDWTADVRSGKRNKALVALGATLYDQAVTAGDTKTAISILVDYVETVSDAAAATQASRILKQLSPDQQLYSLEVLVNKLNKEAQERKDNGKGKDKPKRISAKQRQSDVQKSADEAAEDVAELLARKVEGTTKAPSAPTIDAINDMVNELFRSAKESPLPKNEAAAKRNPIEFLAQAIANKAQYADVWNKAKDILKEKYADNPDVLNMLTAYFEKGIVPTYSEKTLNDSINLAISDLNVKLSEIKELSWSDRQKAIKAITDYLIQQTGATGNDAKVLNEKAAHKITMLIINSKPSLTEKQKADIKQATADAMRKHGETVEDWNAENGRLLAQKLIDQTKEKTAQPTPVMKTILNDLLKFANEHATPKAKPVPGRTAVDIIRDYFANKAAYTEAWNMAQRKIREKYAKNPEALESFDEWINSTIDYNADPMHTDKIMLSAVLSTADSLGLDAKTIRDLTALGTRETVITRIADAFVSAIGVKGADATQVRDAVRRHINELTGENTIVDKRLGTMVKGATNDTITDISKLLKVSWERKEEVAQKVAQYLIDKHDISKADADAVTKRITDKFYEQLNALEMKRLSDDMTIDPALAEAFLKANTKEARLDALDDLYQNIADQITSTWQDKWNAWRYMSMLGNTLTHIRNVAGNVGFMPPRLMKNLIATSIESIVLRKGDRTKAFITRNDRGLLSAAWNDFAEAEEMVMGTGKFTDSKGAIRDRVRVYKAGALEALRTANTKALNFEDKLFSKPAYTTALAGYMKANKITAEQWSDGTLSLDKVDAARAYAIREAQRATYRDHNAFSDFVAKLRVRETDNRAQRVLAKVVNAAVESTLPFKRTPANILVRAFEYSPLGLMNGIKQAMFDVRKGNVTAAEAIDNIAAGMTGTVLVGLGALFCALGKIRGGADDDEENVNKLTGAQEYSLEIGGKSYTLSWLAPAALPFFVGVEIYKVFMDKNKEATLASVLSAISTIAEPMLEMSMLQGITDTIDGIRYSKNNPVLGIISTAVVNYLSQGLPTLFGQAERITEKQRESTIVDDTSGIPTSMQYMLGKAANKIPIFDFQQQPYIDPLGKTQSSGTVFERIVKNLFSPAYVSNIKTDTVTNELVRLYEENAGVSIPEQPGRNFTYGGEKYSMSGEDYTQYSTTLGQTAATLMKEAIRSTAYKSLPDTMKAELHNKIQEFARDEAKRELVISRGGKYDSDWNDERDLPDLPEYLAVKTAYSSMENSGGDNANTFTKMLGVYNTLSKDAQAILDDTPGFKDAALVRKNGVNMQKYYDIKEDISAEAKKQGKSSISYAEQCRIALAARLPAKHTNAVFESILPSGTYAKYTTATDAGYSTDRFLDFYETYNNTDAKNDADESVRGLKKERVIEWARENGYTEAEIDFFWRLFS